MSNINYLFEQACEALGNVNTDLWIVSREMELAARDHIQPGEENLLFDLRMVQTRAERGVRAAHYAARSLRAHGIRRREDDNVPYR